MGVVLVLWLIGFVGAVLIGDRKGRMELGATLGGLLGLLGLAILAGLEEAPARRREREEKRSEAVAAAFERTPEGDERARRAAQSRRRQNIVVGVAVGLICIGLVVVLFELRALEPESEEIGSEREPVVASRSATSTVVADLFEIDVLGGWTPKTETKESGGVADRVLVIRRDDEAAGWSCAAATISARRRRRALIDDSKRSRGS